MDTGSPRKIQFTVPLLDTHLDPEAAEQPGPVPQPIPAAHGEITGTDTHSDGATMLETVPVSQSVATPTTPLS
ncbi:hypothetical protein CRUP_025049, partial [Coryphaenoides rupestris]